MEKQVVEDLKGLFISEYLNRKDQKIKSLHRRKMEIQKQKEEYIKSSLLNKIAFKLEKSEILYLFLGALYGSLCSVLLVSFIIMLINLFLTPSSQIGMAPIFCFFWLCFTLFSLYCSTLAPKCLFKSIEKSYYDEKLKEIDNKIIEIFEIEKMIVDALVMNNEFEKSNEKLLSKKYKSFKIHKEIIDKFEKIIVQHFDKKEHLLKFINLRNANNFIELNDALADFK